ncbi:MAG: oxidoreductase, partial [Pseudomonadota bacterium]
MVGMTLLSLLAPAALVAFAIFAFSQKGPRPDAVKFVPWVGRVMMVGAAALTGFLAYSMMTPGAVTMSGFFLIDLVSVPLILLVSVIGAILLGFSRDYLDGEERQGPFLGWMSLTLASVLMLVSSGHLLLTTLMWISTSVCLYRLLTFYAERRGTRRMGRKNLVCEVISNGALIGAMIILWASFGTGSVQDILASTRAGDLPALTGLAAALLAIAAITSVTQPWKGNCADLMMA